MEPVPHSVTLPYPFVLVRVLTIIFQLVLYVWLRRVLVLFNQFAQVLVQNANPFIYHLVLYVHQVMDHAHLIVFAMVLLQIVSPNINQIQSYVKLLLAGHSTALEIQVYVQLLLK